MEAVGGKKIEQKIEQKKSKRQRRDVPFPPTTFDAYYRELAVDAADHEALLAAMRRPLPTAFRSAGDEAAIDASDPRRCC